MDPIMGSRANVRPPLTINAISSGYADIDSASGQDDADTVIQGDDMDEAEGSRRGKRKRPSRSNGANELLEALKQKWEDDKEAEEIITRLRGQSIWIS
jgi:hypothetical protein